MVVGQRGRRTPRAELDSMAAAIGRPARQRTTDYSSPPPDYSSPRPNGCIRSALTLADAR